MRLAMSERERAFFYECEFAANASCRIGTACAMYSAVEGHFVAHYSLTTELERRSSKHTIEQFYRPSLGKWRVSILGL